MSHGEGHGGAGASSADPCEDGACGHDGAGHGHNGAGHGDGGHDGASHGGHGGHGHGGAESVGLGSACGGVCGSPPPASDEEGEGGDATGQERLVGGLILRGHRCILARSLEKEWEGLRIPWVAANRGETPAATAMRAVSELCEIDEEEIFLLQGVPPVALAVPGLPTILVHVLYARHAPPEGSTPDKEDPEDIYDWFTFPRAMEALAEDPYARASLATLACALAVGSAAGTVPDQWGGIFGQEWSAPALQMLHGAKGPLPLSLERSTCTVDSLLAATAAAASSVSAGNADDPAAKRPRTE